MMLDRGQVGKGLRVTLRMEGCEVSDLRVH